MHPHLSTTRMHTTYMHMGFERARNGSWKEMSERGDKEKSQRQKVNEHALQNGGVKVKLEVGEIAGFYPQQPAGTS